MKSETNEWVEKAEKDIIAAEKSYNSSEYEWSAFQTQQAIEKALKAVILKKERKIIKIHDLVLLGKKAGLPDKLIGYCKEISIAYIYSRYPDVPKLDINESKFKDYLEEGKEIIKWVKKKI